MEKGNVNVTSFENNSRGILSKIKERMYSTIVIKNGIENILETWIEVDDIKRLGENFVLHIDHYRIPVKIKDHD